MDVLKNKSYKQYDKVSRYSSFPYYYQSEDNKYIYGITAQLNDTTPYVVHKIEQNDTPDSLALKYYNNPTYFWIICDFNRIRDPYKKLVVGESIKIPVFSNIEFDI